MRVPRKQGVFERLERASRPRLPVVATPLGAGEGPEGPPGADGEDGRPAGLAYRFLTATTNSDPGSGNLKLNAAAGTATVIRISETDADGIGQSAYLSTWDDSTSTVKGVVFIRSVANPDRFILKQATAHADAGAYRNITVESANDVVSGTLENEEAVTVQFFRSGDKGDQGEKGDTGAEGPPGEDGADGEGAVDYGRVSSAGAKVSGSGFTVKRNSTGNYTITFSSELATASPAVVVTPVTTAAIPVWTVGGTTKTTAEIRIWNFGSGTAADLAFSFAVYA